MMTATWVGMLDLDDGGPAAGISGPLDAGQPQARVLICAHGAPLGFVWVRIPPADTFTARVRIAAETTLAGAIRRHAERDKLAAEPGGAAWPAAVACPRHFPARAGTGITVAVCTRNRVDQLRDCLEALGRSTYEPLEILVVDNAPAGEATRELVTALSGNDPRIRYACEPRPGLSAARNRALARARYDIVAYTDDDVLVGPAWPSAIAGAFSADPCAACVTGPVVARRLDTAAQRYLEERVPWGEEFEPRRYDLYAHRQPSRLYPFTAGMFGTGANFAVRTSAIELIGGFDELLGAGGPGRGGEELDMFLRLILSGQRICYAPCALVWHEHYAEVGALGQQMYSYGHGLGAYLAKHLSTPGLRSALARHGVRHLGVLARRMRGASAVSGLASGGLRLALDEARGVVAGAWHYRRAAHQAARRS